MSFYSGKHSVSLRRIIAELINELQLIFPGRQNWQQTTAARCVLENPRWKPDAFLISFAHLFGPSLSVYDIQPKHQSKAVQWWQQRRPAGNQTGTSDCFFSHHDWRCLSQNNVIATFILTLKWVIWKLESVSSWNSTVNWDQTRS